jgi:uncharacterized linocin/CFP29 family protein
MDNLHRELAPISAAAWSGIEQEAKRTFTLHVAGRQIADMPKPAGPTLAAVGTGHLDVADPPAEGVLARLRQAQRLVELRVPFSLDRRAIDDVERGARDPDWQPVKDAARAAAFAEDRAIFDGYPAAGIGGLRTGAANPALALPGDPRAFPEIIGQALSSLRMAGVGGPYALLLSTAAYNAAAEASDHGYPVRDHLARLVDGQIIWAPAIDGGLLVSVRGGDYELYLGEDLSIGYESHDTGRVRLYLLETMTFMVYTPEAAVPLGASPI